MAKDKKELTERQAAIKNDLEKAAALDAMATSEGGKILVEGLIQDALSSIETLCAKYATMTQQEFVAECSDLKKNLDLARAIKRSKAAKEELDKLFKESLGE